MAPYNREISAQTEDDQSCTESGPCPIDPIEHYYDAITGVARAEAAELKYNLNDPGRSGWLSLWETYYCVTTNPHSVEWKRAKRELDRILPRDKLISPWNGRPLPCQCLQMQADKHNQGLQFQLVRDTTTIDDDVTLKAGQTVDHVYYMNDGFAVGLTSRKTVVCFRTDTEGGELPEVCPIDPSIDYTDNLTDEQRSLELERSVSAPHTWECFLGLWRRYYHLKPHSPAWQEAKRQLDAMLPRELEDSPCNGQPLPCGCEPSQEVPCNQGVTVRFIEDCDMVHQFGGPRKRGDIVRRVYFISTECGIGLTWPTEKLTGGRLTNTGGLYAPILVVFPLGAVELTGKPPKPMFVACTDVRGNEAKLRLSVGDVLFDCVDLGDGAWTGCKVNGQQGTFEQQHVRSYTGKPLNTHEDEPIANTVSPSGLNGQDLPRLPVRCKFISIKNVTGDDAWLNLRVSWVIRDAELIADDVWFGCNRKGAWGKFKRSDVAPHEGIDPDSPQEASQIFPANQSLQDVPLQTLTTPTLTTPTLTTPTLTTERPHGSGGDPPRYFGSPFNAWIEYCENELFPRSKQLLSKHAAKYSDFTRILEQLETIRKELDDPGVHDTRKPDLSEAIRDAQTQLTRAQINIADKATSTVTARPHINTVSTHEGRATKRTGEHDGGANGAQVTGSRNLKLGIHHKQNRYEPSISSRSSLFPRMPGAFVQSSSVSRSSTFTTKRKPYEYYKRSTTSREYSSTSRTSSLQAKSGDDSGSSDWRERSDVDYGGLGVLFEQYLGEQINAECPPPLRIAIDSNASAPLLPLGPRVDSATSSPSPPPPAAEVIYPQLPQAAPDAHTSEPVNVGNYRPLGSPPPLGQQNVAATLFDRWLPASIVKAIDGLFAHFAEYCAHILTEFGLMTIKCIALAQSPINSGNDSNDAGIDNSGRNNSIDLRYLHACTTHIRTRSHSTPAFRPTHLP
ncbi:hypothetical protein LTS18_007829 [Coniosporium uncinatum]|uniref:Uncharacterized protein n=1 Tax=Coniosporium uncinatum TaxID=93489 RepID=A0ACC3DZK5_9PEZI|nr:hypothetical protein LTS18_007829 [Coniosporium uncinatum]